MRRALFASGLALAAVLLAAPSIAAAGEKVILVDDLIATGGTAEGATKLLRQMGADIVAACFVIDLPDLGGRAKLEALPTEEQRHARLCELNVIEQVTHVCRTTIVRDAWLRGQKLAVHGWIYGVGDGLLRDLSMCVTAEAELLDCYASACERLATEPDGSVKGGPAAGR